MSDDGDSPWVWQRPDGQALVTCDLHRNNENPFTHGADGVWPRPPCEVCDLIAFGGHNLLRPRARRGYEREFHAATSCKEARSLQAGLCDLLGVVWVGGGAGTVAAAGALVDARAKDEAGWAEAVAGTLQQIVGCSNSVGGRKAHGPAGRLYAHAVGANVMGAMRRVQLWRRCLPIDDRDAEVAFALGVRRSDGAVVVSMKPRDRDPEVWGNAIAEILGMVCLGQNGADTLSGILTEMGKLFDPVSAGGADGAGIAEGAVGEG